MFITIILGVSRYEHRFGVLPPRWMRGGRCCRRKWSAGQRGADLVGAVREPDATTPSAVGLEARAVAVVRLVSERGRSARDVADGQRVDAEEPVEHGGDGSDGEDGQGGGEHQTLDDAVAREGRTRLLRVDEEPCGGDDAGVGRGGGGDDPCEAEGGHQDQRGCQDGQHEQ